MKLSTMAASLRPSPILTIAAEINRRIANGDSVMNLTIGDFNPALYPIPEGMTQKIVDAYQQHETNYPGAFGLDPLREAIRGIYQHFADIDVSLDEILVASGSRPLIYALYRTVLNPGEKVVFPVPSWNNDYYAELNGLDAVMIETLPENHFFPTAEELAPHIKDAGLLALCTPQNPTGTMMSREQVAEICQLVVEENARRGQEEKPLYVMFDQVYWMLTFGDNRFNHALAICPEIRDYAVFIDGASKNFAGTGVRVGWAHGPQDVIRQMCALLTHVGSWAPRPEQVAMAKFLAEINAVEAYLAEFRASLQASLDGFYQGIQRLKQAGYPVDAIEPKAAIYLSLRLDLVGKQRPDGKELTSNSEVREFLLDAVGIAILSFDVFGTEAQGNWYRISVGTCTTEQVEETLKRLETVLSSLS